MTRRWAIIQSLCRLLDPSKSSVRKLSESDGSELSYPCFAGLNPNLTSGSIGACSFDLAYQLRTENAQESNMSVPSVPAQTIAPNCSSL